MENALELGAQIFRNFMSYWHELTQKVQRNFEIVIVTLELWAEIFRNFTSYWHELTQKVPRNFQIVIVTLELGAEIFRNFISYWYGLTEKVSRNSEMVTLGGLIHLTWNDSPGRPFISSCHWKSFWISGFSAYTCYVR